MSSERLKNVYGCTFIGKGCEEGATPTVTTSPLEHHGAVSVHVTLGVNKVENLLKIFWI